MLVILEGADGAGKSTLAQHLIEYIEKIHPGEPVKLLHAKAPTSHPLDEYVVPLLDYRPSRGQHIICDRWHIGEWIYPAELGRSTQADIATWRYIEMFLQSRGAVVAHVDQPDTVISERVSARGDDVVTAQQAVRVARTYRDVMSNVILPVNIIRERYTHPTVEKLMWRAALYERSAAQLNQFTTYVGGVLPRYVLLGDVRRETDLTPAFMPYPGTSGQFLLSHLPWPFADSNLGLLNVNDVDSLSLMHKLLGRAHYIALGDDARTTALDVIPSFQLSAIEHPHNVQQFRSEQGEQYGMALACAAMYGRNDAAWRP